MHIIIEREHLIEIVARATSIVEAKRTVPILGHVVVGRRERVELHGREPVGDRRASGCDDRSGVAPDEQQVEPDPVADLATELAAEVDQVRSAAKTLGKATLGAVISRRDSPGPAAPSGRP